MSPSNDTTTETLTSPSLHMPTLPFDLILEILCRLPVKLLLQLKCVCKSWKSLISNPKFAKKHLHVSITYHHHHLIVTRRDSLHWNASISSIFNDTTTTSRVQQLQLIRPGAINNRYFASCDTVCSCDSILLFAGTPLFATNKYSALLWNPSIRKFKILPSLLSHRQKNIVYIDPPYTFGFGYDRFIDNYKVFAVTYRNCHNEASVYTLGTKSWRRINDFPYSGPIRESGMFVSGTVNWLVFNALFSFLHVIVSLDLEKESYQTLLMPDMNRNQLLRHDLAVPKLKLGVLRNCLCIFARGVEFFDVWVMKEYGIEESWTKLFSVPYMGSPVYSFYTKVVYVFEDDQVLLDFRDYNELPKVDLKLVVYDFKNGTFKIPKIQNISDWIASEVYVESLISPCS